MAGLRDQLREDVKTAMRAKDALRRDTIRLLQAAIKNADIEQRGEVGDAVVLTIIQKQLRQRQDSIEQFEAGGRADLADRERAEIGVLEAYLPAQMDRDAIMAAAQAVVARTGASGPGDKGKVMGPLMGQLRGKADGPPRQRSRGRTARRLMRPAPPRAGRRMMTACRPRRSIPRLASPSSSRASRCCSRLR